MIEAQVAIFAALMVLDIVQTWFFPRFGLREGNPLMAKLMAEYGFGAMAAAKVIVALILGFAAWQGWVPLAVMWIAIGLQGAVVTWNAYKMMRNT